ncbi:MAG: HD domain-containing protein [Oscillospiraceae bacterium]|nr:HD domain-containing protein [Oscillospiraceae bacterium]
MKMGERRLTTKERQAFIHCAEKILASETVQKMKQYPQHGSTNALCHMVSVAWKAYSLAVHLEERWGIRFDRESIIRGALLHDLFLYDWHDPNNGHKLHGFSHPYTALENAEKLFFLNQRERNIIKRHMFPFTPIPPKYRESLLVSYADKVCSTNETLHRKKLCGACHVCPLRRDRRLGAGEGAY